MESKSNNTLDHAAGHVEANLDTRRIDPRRPFTITSEGLIRITLCAATDVRLSGLTNTAVDHGAISLQGGHGHGAQPKGRRTTQTAQRSFVVAAYSDRGVLNDHARQTLAAAALLADAITEVVLLVFGEFSDDAAALGADKVVVQADCDRRIFAPEKALQALAACAQTYRPVHVFIPDTASGDGDLGRRYAARTQQSVATQVVEIDARHVSVYGDAKRQYASRSLPPIILLAINAVEAKLPFVGAGERIETLPSGIGSMALSPTDARESTSSLSISPSLLPASAQTALALIPGAGDYRDVGIEDIDAASVALEEADFIVSAGNGVNDVVAFERLATTLGAAVGASRVAVDDGKFARDKQIGATGKTVEASVYIAFGISGAVQHLQGIKDCRHVIAVNLDASAPIAKRANLTVIADAAQTIAALSDAVTQAVAQAASAKHGALPMINPAAASPLLPGDAQTVVASGVFEGATL